MEPETVAQIKSWQGMNEEEAKLLFIRKNAQEAFEKGEILEETKGILKIIVEVAMISNMSRDEISFHIGNLERARHYLAAFTQGLQIGHAADVEPKIKAKREKERQEKLLAKVTSKEDKKVNDLIALARKLAETGEVEKKEVKVVTKVQCPQCQKEVFSLKYHKC